MKKPFFILLAAFLAGSLSLQAQSVDDLVNQHIEALGGRQKVEAIKAVQIQQNMYAGNFNVPQTVSVIANESVRVDTKSMGSTITMSVGKQSNWQINPFVTKDNTAIPLDKASAAQLKQQMKIFGPLVDYKEAGHAVELIGKEVVDQTDAYKIKLTYKSGYSMFFFLDSKNYYIVKAEFPSGSITYEDHEKVQGVVFPFTTTLTSSQGKVSTRISKITINPKTLNEDFFQQPAKTK